MSVVKSVLHRNCSELTPPDDIPFNDTTWCDYEPFNTDDSSKLFGLLDSAFLFSYAIAMFISGYVAERVSLRYFLSFGMILSGIFTYLFGIAKPFEIHSLWYFIIVQALAGICQTTGWPGVVTVVGRWFGKSKRGLIFGIWNSHTSIGNILGSLIAAYYVEKDWSLSFIYPGIIMAVVGFILFLFLIDSPDLMGPERRHEYSSDIESYERDDDVSIISFVYFTAYGCCIVLRFFDYFSLYNEIQGSHFFINILTSRVFRSNFVILGKLCLTSEDSLRLTVSSSGRNSLMM